ncbi:class I adenylate-forming enzyme family protein [Nocardia goodfellowii]
MDALASGLAVTLTRSGVRAGQRVALMSSTRPELIIAVYAIWRLGAAVVLLSPAWKHDEVAYALSITEPAHAVGDHPVLAGLMPMHSLDEPIAPYHGESPVLAPDADALLVFSSGTTGLPKAVRHSHATLSAAVQHWRNALTLTANDRIQVLTPPSHILGLLNVVVTLETGAWLRLHRRFDVRTMLRCVQNDRITIEMAVAPIALALASLDDLESYDLSSLRYIMWGATPVMAGIAETVTRRTGVGWLPAYGASEVPVIACNPIEGARLDRVGKPVPGVELRVVSIETGAIVAPGELGEIEVRAASTMIGYLPAAATETVLHDGWFRTGDVGRLDADGWLQVTDRSKEMIKVRGFQIAPAEIEAVLHGHPAVDDCAVIGVPDAADGQAVVAVVTTVAPVTDTELTALVAERLATYKQVRRVVFTDQIPRLPSGKVLRRVLEERYGRTSDK